MTAVPGDEFEDPEEQAQAAADKAFERAVYRKAAVLLAVMVAALAVIAGDYAFGVMALPLVTPPTSWLLAGFIAGDLATGLSRWQRERRERLAHDAQLAEGERHLASLDRMRDLPAPWWRAGPRSRRFWVTLAFRAVYVASAEVVLAHYFGLAAGTAGAVAYIVVTTALGPGLRSSTGGFVTVASFTDPRNPRDTPEA